MPSILLYSDHVTQVPVSVRSGMGGMNLHPHAGFRDHPAALLLKREAEAIQAGFHSLAHAFIQFSEEEPVA